MEITDASTGLENVNAGFIIPKEVEPPDRDSPEAIWKGQARIAQVPIHQHEGEAEGVVGSEHKTERTTESPAKPTKPGGVNFISMLLRTAATISEVIEEAYRSLSSRPRSGRCCNLSRNACLKPQCEWLYLCWGGILLQVHWGLLEMSDTKPITFEISKQSKRKQGIWKVMPVLISCWCTVRDGQSAHFSR